MVIENQIPKTETVYKIKNNYEVPSYEEFMKTYETDGNVNYADLNDGNVGEVKGYGPCSYCNKDCTCYVSSGYAPLYMSCPSCSNNNLSV
jgi:hypothetical protein